MADSDYATLSAGVVSTITLDADYGSAEVLNLTGTSRITVTTDGSTPVANGRGTLVMPAAINAMEIHDGGKVFKFLSAGTDEVYVRGW